MIRVTCSSCRQDLYVAARQVVIHATGNASCDQYAFTCDRCGHRNHKWANPQTVQLLTAAGVQTIPAGNFETVIVQFADELRDDAAIADELERMGRT